MNSMVETPAVCIVCGNISVDPTGFVHPVCPLCKGSLRKMNVSPHEGGPWEIHPPVCLGKLRPEDIDARIDALKDTIQLMGEIMKVWHSLGQEVENVKKAIEAVVAKDTNGTKY